MIDAYGSRAFGRSDCWRRMQEAGAECVEALPLGLPIIGGLFQRMDLRNHRKIVVIDHAIGFYRQPQLFGHGLRGQAVRFAPWVDILLRIRGPVVRQMQAVVLQDWMSYTGEDLGDILVMAPSVCEPGEIAQVVATGPDDRQGSLVDCMATMVYGAAAAGHHHALLRPEPRGSLTGI